MKRPAKRPGSRLLAVLLVCTLLVCTLHARGQQTTQTPTPVFAPDPPNTPAAPAPQDVKNESVSAAEAQRLQPQQQLTPQQRAVLQARPVARLSHLAGSVQVETQAGSPGSAVQGALNMPLLEGERILAGDGGEAEVEFPDGSVLRMTPNSSASLEQLSADNGATQIGLGDGLFYLELRSSDRSSYTVAIGDTALAPQQNSSFRVRVTQGQVEAAVLSGLVSITRVNAYTADLQAGESLRSDPRNSKRYLLADSVPAESWDNWNEKLAQAALDAQNARTSVRDNYAGDQGYGWSDLDASGSWYNVPGEGQVWQPASVDLNFDPYASGSWVDGGSGYVWASGYGWGWLPYRCGTWGYYAGFGWGWIPTAGCRNFAGWYGGGFGDGAGYGYGGGVWNFPVRHPPLGWHGPTYPLDQTSNSLSIHRLATVPVDVRRTGARGDRPWQGQPRSGEPLRIGGMPVTPLRPVAYMYTSRGQSAVGSSFARDYPVQTGTHTPLLGRMTNAPAALPGRPAEWHATTGSSVTSGPPGVLPGSILNANGLRGEGSRAQRNGNGLRNGAGTVPYNVTGPVPLNATGTVPAHAAGEVPLGATGQVPVNATGATPVGATGAVPLPGRIGYGGVYGGRTGVTPLPSRPVVPGPEVIRPVTAQPALAPRPMTPAPAAPAPMAPRIAAPSPAAPAAHVSAPSPSAPPNLRTK